MKSWAGIGNSRFTMGAAVDGVGWRVFWATPMRAPQRVVRITEEPGVPSIDRLLDDHADDVHRLVWRLLGPGAERADVEDLGQQIFMALHVALPKFRGDSKTSTWVYGIASRIVYRELRSRTRHRRMVRTLEAKVAVLEQRGPAAPPQEVLLELESVWRCLMRIHPKKRMVYVLYEVEGLSGAEIAEALGVKEGTVHTRLYHARRELMRMLEAKR